MNLGAILFGGITLLFQGATLMLAYETYAVWVGKDATISKIVAYHFATHPALCFLGAFIAGGVVCGLLVHFTNWKVG
jgi:hypothetical protein